MGLDSRTTAAPDTRRAAGFAWQEQSCDRDRLRRQAGTAPMPLLTTAYLCWPSMSKAVICVLVVVWGVCLGVSPVGHG
jgi:hypothetical protein